MDLDKKEGVGVFGGTFDPIHNGHLVVAETVSHRLNLERIWFLPAGRPWLKSDRKISPAADRTEMVNLAIAGEPNYMLSTLETDHPGPSYTVDTISRIQEKLGLETPLFFIAGWDSITDLPKWKESQKLVKLCRIAAVPRPGASRPDIQTLNQIIPGIAESVILLDEPNVNISSTEIRQRVAAGLPILGMVPEKVAVYIRERGLYR